MVKKQKTLTVYQRLVNLKTEKQANPVKSELLSLVLHVTFAFVVIVSVSAGLRTVELGVNNKDLLMKQLRVKTVLAAETINQAELVQQSHTIVNIKPNQAFTFTLKFKNTGTSVWTKETVFLKARTTAQKFMHKYWEDSFHPAKLMEESVAPDEIGTFVFALQAPQKYKDYSGDFILVNNNYAIKGGEITVEMNVVADLSAIKKVVATPETKTNEKKTDLNKIVKRNTCTLNLKIAAVSGEPLNNVSCTSSFDLPEDGPEIKAGLFYTDKAISIKNTKNWEIYDENDTLLSSIQKNQIINFIYLDKKGEYVFDDPNLVKTLRTSKYLKIKNPYKGIFEITSLKDIPSWNQSLNYNKFKGELQIKYNDYKDRVWVVNQLPLENYLKGIKETSNPDPIEYLKTMTVAARSYALYHLNRLYGTDSFFDVYTDEKDQVYRGYTVEETHPNLTKAVEATRGVVATFDDQVILSYYSARSAGQTETDSSHAYLKAVPAKYSAEIGTEWGHSLGIDQYNAKAQAEKESLTYDELLRYYYTGIDLEKIY